MKKVVRLTESELVGLIKNVLKEQTKNKTTSVTDKVAFANSRIPIVKDAYCSTKYGKITAGPLKGKMFCDVKKRIEEYNPNITLYEWKEKCPNAIIFTTPIIPNEEKQPGWDDIFLYFKNGTDGSKLTQGVRQTVCQNFYHFIATMPNLGELWIYSTGEAFLMREGAGRYNSGKWKWEEGKPVFDFPITKKAVGYAQTEEDITDNNKILFMGSKNDLVKRLQYELLGKYYPKFNSGCKKDTDGKFKPTLCDGIFGQKTKEAVIQFQKDERLRDKSGIVGSETWDSLAPAPIDTEGFTPES